MSVHPPVEFPEAFVELFQPASYKGYFGGRGSAKSHSIATALLLVGAGEEPKRILCAREIQNSIKDSVKRLFDDKIASDPRLSKLYFSTQNEIRGANGTLILFKGLRTNADSVRSTEGLDIVWIEEANTVSEASLRLLAPTVRKKGSEQWFTWNPRYETDPCDRLLRKNPPPGSIVRKVSWLDNPWFNETRLPEELEWDRQRDPDKYAHVWLGEYLRNSEARVFKNWRVEPFETPDTATFYFGADWGFSVDPSVLVRCWFKDRTLYVDHEAYSVKCEIDHLPALFSGDDDRVDPVDRTTKLKPRWENPSRFPGIPASQRWTIRADSARPETISHVAKRGFKIVSARKGPNSVIEGVEFIQNHDVVVHPRCKHVIDELSLYAYKQDPLTGDVMPVLQDKNNHCIDALRYAVEERRYNSGKWSMPIIGSRPHNFPG
jgi:phage terminase large subunit